VVSYDRHGTGINVTSDGYFGYAGLFALPDGGTARVYATRWDRMVRIQTADGEPYLLSPAEVELFVETVKKVVLGE